MQVHPGSSPRLSGVPPQGIPRKEGLLPTPANTMPLPVIPLTVVSGSKPARGKQVDAEAVRMYSGTSL